MFQWFEVFFKWLFEQVRAQEEQKGSEVTSRLQVIDKHYQVKSELLDMERAAMESDYDEQLARIERAHQVKMAQLNAERKGISTKALKQEYVLDGEFKEIP